MQSSSALPQGVFLTLSRPHAAAMGGAEVLARTLHDRLRRSGVDVKLVEGIGKYGRICEYASKLALTLWCIFKSPKPRTVLVHYGNVLDLLVSFVIARANARVYLLAHVGRDRAHLRRGPLHRCLMRMMRAHALEVLCLTREQFLLFRRFARVHMVPTIIEKEFAAPPRLAADTKTILFLGRISKKKGVLDLIAAFEMLQVPHARLRIIGPLDPVEGEEIQNRIRSSAAAAHIQIEGPVFDVRAKMALYASSSVVALPSYAEALPLVMIEALACGVPVVVSKVGECGRFLKGTEELLVSPGDVPGLAAALGTVLEGRFDAAKLKRLTQVAQSVATGALVDRLLELGVLPQTICTRPASV